MTDTQSKESLLEENQKLRERLEEIEGTIRAFQNGEVDAFVLPKSDGDQILTLQGALDPYRVMVENMGDGAVTVAADGTILYSNNNFDEQVKLPHEQIIGQKLQGMIATEYRDAFDAMLAQGKNDVVREELALLAANGEVLPVLFSMRPLPGSEGETISIVITDLSEIIAGQETRQRLALIVESLSDAIVSVTLEGIVQTWNKAAETLFGYTSQEAVGQSLLDLIVPAEDVDEVRQKFDVRRSGKKGKPKDVVRRRKDGSLIQVAVRGIPQPDIKGQIVGVSINYRDITERVEALKKIRESEENFRTIFEAVKNIIFILDPSGNFTSLSPSLKTITGFSPNEWVGRHFSQFVHPDDLVSAQEFFREVLAGQSFDEIEIRVLKKNGDYFYCEISVDAKQYKDVLQIVGTAHDITERKQAELALRQTSSELEEAQRVAHVGSWRLDVKTGEVTWSMETYRIFGFDPTQAPPVLDEHGQILRPDSLARMNDAIEHTRKTGEPFKVDLELVRPDNSTGWVVSRGEVVRDEMGRVTFLRGTAADITERKESEKSLRLFRELVDNSSDSIEVIDPDTLRFLDINKTACRSMGYNREELLSMRVPDIDPIFDDDASAAFKKQLRETGSAHFNGVHRRKDGSVFPVEVSSTLINLDKPYLLAIARDVTERNHAEEVLLESKNFLQLIVEHVPAQIFWKDRDLRFLGCNTPFAKKAGYSSPEELIGKTDLDMGWKDQAELYRADDRAVLESGDPKLNYVEPQTTPDGDMSWLRTSKVPLRDTAKQIIGVLGLFQDITAEKKAADKLVESERRYNDMLENVELISIMLDREGLITFCNEYLLRLTGWQRDEVIGQNWFELFLPDEIKNLKGEFYAALLADQPEVKHHENEIHTRSGERRMIVWNNSVLRSAAGDVIGIASIGEDITERLQAEKALRASEIRFKTMFEQAPLGIAQIDSLNGKIYEVNSRFAEIAGRSIEAMANIDWQQITHPDDVQKDLDNMALLNAGKINGFQMEKRYLHPDGTVVWIDMTVSPLTVEDKGLSRHLCMIQDISERKAAEERVAYLSRVHSVLSGINALIVRALDHDELFRGVCQIATEAGGFLMAMVCMVDNHTKKIVPVATAGKDEELLTYIKDFLSSDEGTSKSMVGQALSTKQALVANDSKNDPRVLFGKHYAEAGVRSMAVLPLIVSGKSIGVLALYAREAEFFHKEELDLLHELAGHITYAIDHIDRQEKLNQNEERLLLFRTLLDNSIDGIEVIDPETQAFLDINETECRTLGYSREEMLSMHIADIDPGITADILKKLMTQIQQTGEARFERVHRRKDGSVFPVEINASLSNVDRPYLLTIVRDITERKQAEEALRASETEFQTLAESMPQIVWIATEESGNIYFNQQWMDYTGLTLEESLGDGCNKSFHPEDQQVALDAWQNATQNQGIYSIECRLRRADGAYRWWLMRGVPLVDDSGNVLKWFGTCTDIHDLKMAELKITYSNLELRESQRRFSDMLENLEMVSMMRDRDENITYCNEYLLDMTGWTREEIIGRNWAEVFLPAETVNVQDELFAKQLHGHSEVMHHECEIITHSGERRLMRWNHSVLRSTSNDVVGLASIGEDITEVKQAREAVYKLNQKLEEKVLKRTAELEHARMEADHANRAKSEFLAAMSHEIRTPMNGVIGMIDVLQQSSLNEAQMDMAHIIHDSAYALLNVINDILDFSKIEAGKITLDSAPMSLIETVEGVGDMLAQTALKKKVSLLIFIDPALPDQIIGDVGRLRQILVNLVSNAIKFSSGLERPGKVSLRARLLDLDEQKVSVEFSVIDNGIGMDRATQKRLFTPFAQATNSTAARYGGTGLGLVITEQLVQAKEGEIEMHSEPGKGTEMFVRLSYAQVPHSADVSKLRLPLAGVHCLVVGVKGDIADDLSSYLACAGAQLERVDDADAALKWLGNCRVGPYVVVFDRAVAESLLADMRVIAHSRSNMKLGFLMSVSYIEVGRGRRRRSRIKANDLVTLDAEVMHRNELIKAVGMAAGRISPDAEEQVVSNGSKPAITPPTRELAIQQNSLILVAEDNEINQRVILQQLSRLGRTADVANNGREALAMWKSGKYSILITDLNMPEMNGYELATAIRAAENDESHIPIIAFTANALKGEEDHCLKMGMDGYVSKPVVLDDLRAELGRWLPPAGEEVLIDSAPYQTSDAHPLPVAIDENVLKTLVGDEQEVIQDFLHDFRLSAVEIAGELRVACDTWQATLAAELSHKLKSSSRSVGALGLGDICEAMEHAGKDGDMAALGELLPKFEQELAAVEQYMDEY